MRKSWVQLYAPFLVLMLVQALFVAVSPSRGPQDQSLASLNGANASGALGSSELAGAGDGAAVVDPVTGQVSGTGATGTASRATSAGAKASGAVGGVVSGVKNDVSHCKDGFQIKLIVTNPAPCTPKFVGDNGGATYQGVTKDTIKVIRVTALPNDQVNTILGAKGLATTEAESNAFDTAAWAFVQKYYETYGRKIAWENVVMDCPTSPPDYDKCNAAAQEIVKRKPALVIWITSLYASVFDIWAKAGIPSIGGSAFDEKFYIDRRPFRFDVGMDGTEAANHISEYYCKKMAGKNVSHSGRLIHRDIGARDAVKRKLGIVVPEIEANVLTAKAVAAAVKACGGGEAPFFTYESDIERAAEQTQATTANLISNKITTVVCMCDPIAPVFQTAGFTGNEYFPEYLLPGLGLLDYDLLGQLYDPQQMQHAFGPSHLSGAQQQPLDNTDPALVWRHMGNSGHPCGNNGCGLNWAFINMAGIAIQAAGPNYNPLNLERGILNLPPTNPWEPKRNPNASLYKFGPSDYNGVSDVREVYWSSTATAQADGSKGAYVPVDGGKRHVLGTWPSNGLAGIPVSPS